MSRLELNLENCYGIQKMNETIDFSRNNVAIIYAPNGTMKSSLAKTFENIRDGEEVQERIYGYASNCDIKVDNGMDLKSENIMVINPFDENACENQGLLMASEELRAEYIEIHKSIEYKKQILYDKVKEKLKYSLRTKFSVRDTILEDWEYITKDEYEFLNKILESIDNPDMFCGLSEGNLEHNILFNSSIDGIMKSGDTSELIIEYGEKYDELLTKSPYMQKGIIDHNNYGEISKSLNTNGFFKANNEVKLIGKDGINSVILKSQKELDELIKNEKEQILETKEMKSLFEKINKLMTKNKDTKELNRFLQENQEILVEYKDINRFKRKVWTKAFTCYKIELNELIDEYNEAKERIKEISRRAKNEVTEWEEAIDLFKNRFYVPFDISISNKDDVVLGEELPSFKYSFIDNESSQDITKEALLETLSTGEKRAYYILNMVFEILVAKKQGEEKIIILDDISESFDYRNKYAIIQYISDISKYKTEEEEPMFKILLLTHNFDFYRTVGSRIAKRSNSYIAYSNIGTICLKKEQYLGNIFGHYKEKLNGQECDKIVVATIPFVRNLIEYIVGDENEDYLLLTNILHYKEDTKNIKLNQLQDIYNEYWCKSKNCNFANGREDDSIYDLILLEASKIDDSEKIDIEDKLILSMSIRLKAEEHMINKILLEVSNGEDIIQSIYGKSNQTGRLLAEYKKHIEGETIKSLELVSMMTPENIHLNSFMFEPILDMSVKHLYDLYKVVKDF